MGVLEWFLVQISAKGAVKACLLLIGRRTVQCLVRMERSVWAGYRCRRQSTPSPPVGGQQLGQGLALHNASVVTT